MRERVFLLGTYVGRGIPERDLDEPPRVSPVPVPGWDPARWRIDEWLEDNREIRGRERYGLRESETAWLEAWNEFINGIPDDPLPGFPIWIDAFRARPSVTDDVPDWKASFLRKNSAFYVRHRRFIDRWMRRHQVDRFPESRRKLEWQARGWPRDLFKLVIHLRPSGIRVKGPTYLPALVAITQTSIIGSRRRRITPREAARLQGFPDEFELHPDDSTAYRQLGNAVNVGVVRHVARSLIQRAPRSYHHGRQGVLFLA